jgi:hypothetical protein
MASRAAVPPASRGLTAQWLRSAPIVHPMPIGQALSRSAHPPEAGRRLHGAAEATHPARTAGSGYRTTGSAPWPRSACEPGESRRAVRPADTERDRLPLAYGTSTRDGRDTAVDRRLRVSMIALRAVARHNDDEVSDPWDLWSERTPYRG